MPSMNITGKCATARTLAAARNDSPVKIKERATRIALKKTARKPQAKASPVGQYDGDLQWGGTKVGAGEPQHDATAAVFPPDSLHGRAGKSHAGRPRGCRQRCRAAIVGSIGEHVMPPLVGRPNESGPDARAVA